MAVQGPLLVVRTAAMLVGLLGVWSVMASSIRTVILPRAVASRITSMVFLATRRFYELRIGRGATYERRDSIMASLAPSALTTSSTPSSC